MDPTLIQERERAMRRRRRPGLQADESSPSTLHVDSDGGSPQPLFRTVDVDTRLLAKALTIRRTEEHLLQLFSRGAISGTVHTCVGQEWVGVAVAESLQPGDYLFSNHRGHGHYIAWTNDVEGLIAEVMGRKNGVCGGRGGSQHLCHHSFFSNGIQGGIVPVAAGLAMAQRMRQNNGISVVYVGDGTLGQGVVYETLNIATLWSLPLLVVVEDNGIAQSTERAETLAGTIGGRAEAFGLDWMETSTDDPGELVAAASDAVGRVRTHRRPFLLHVHTRRLQPHSKGDDTRCPEELAVLAAGDPLNRILAADLPKVHQMLAAVDRRINDAVERASAAPPAHLDMHECSQPIHQNVRWEPLSFSSHRVAEAIRQAFSEALEKDERIVLLGEDIRDPYGGAFKVTAGLSTRFPERVRNTPISEGAMVGIANGLALAGWRPVVEIMFGDFITLAVDQIMNHSAKFAWMYNGKVGVPLVIRTPMGGYRGYGPTHSQSLEKLLLGVPGTRVLALTHRCCPAMLYRELLTTNDRPTIVIENKLLYLQKTDCTPPSGCRIWSSGGHTPTVRISPPGECQLTLVAYGGMGPFAESAMAKLAEDEDLACDLLIPTQLYPLDIQPILESVGRTGRLLVIEEGQGFAGFGAELFSQVACGAAGPARPSFTRVCALPCPIPSARIAEQQALPDVARIVAAARQLVIG